VKGKLQLNGAILPLFGMAIHFQEGIKMQCKYMWSSLEVFIRGNTFFSAR